MTERTNFRYVGIALFALTSALIYRPLVYSQQREESDVERITASGLPVVEDLPDLDAVAMRIIELTNEFRDAEGLTAVRSNSELDKTADYFASYMAKNDKYGHTADGNAPSARAKQHGYDFCIILENIAYQYRSTAFRPNELARAFVEGWKHSPEHRENMLDVDIIQTGVSVAHSKETGHFYAVQMFGRPRSESIEFQIANRSGTTVFYKLGKKTFVLEPRFTRMHEQCRPPELAFLGTDKKEPDTVHQPRDGDAFVVTNDSGDVAIKRQGGE